MGKRDFIGVGLQTALGTPRLAPSHFPPITKESLSIDRETMKADETSGTRWSLPSDYGTRSFAGDVEGLVRPASAPLFFGNALGAPALSTPSAGVYRRLYDPTNISALEPLTIFTVDQANGIVDAYTDVLTDELKLSIEPNGYLTWASKMIALGLDQEQAAPSATRDATKRFHFGDVLAQISVNGGALTTIKLAAYELAIKNGLKIDDAFVLGALTADDYDFGDPSAEVKFTVRGDVSDHYRRLLLDDPDAVRLMLTITGADVTEGNPSSVVVDLKQLQYTEAPNEIDAGDTKKAIEITADVVLDEAINKIMEIAVTNGVASYAA